MLHMFLQHLDKLQASTPSLKNDVHLGGGKEFAKRSQSVKIDIKKYQDMIDHPGLSADERRQIVDALWSMMVMFVDLGFNLQDASSD
ncbi:hypothetical protein [uncultured Sulfitobacter sp.]|uniref:hypothetical protein n=1 Tax=uncultured Sulfitobacter sp. TaxID=191468 RepID=UPI0030D85949|tara:strand:+ start:2589 stop:2849 length:261 start_codon:yes stop_codon:yes gene_type:complete